MPDKPFCPSRDVRAGIAAATAAAAEAAAAADAGLATELDALRARHPVCDIGAVAEVVRAVFATMRGDFTGTELVLLAEMRELRRTVARARAEIAAMQVDDIAASHIPTASDELDAVLTHTASATNPILAECAALDAVAAALQRGEEPRAEAAAIVGRATTRIYEACGFQDLTGQRISKAVAALQAIDGRIAWILAPADGVRAGPARAPAAVPQPAVLPVLAWAGAETLLHGPLLPGDAMNQDDVDQPLAAV
jgi:chemotaxis protein CheZ